MDTTKVEIISKQLESLIASTQHNTNSLTPAWAAIIGAAMGASAVIISQLVQFLLTNTKEKNRLKKELIAEERRLAFLLGEYYKELVMHKVHKKYWYRTSELNYSRDDDYKDSHNRHFTSNQKAFDSLDKIRSTTADYFKTVNHYMNLTEPINSINVALNEIKNYQPRKASDFLEANSYEELLKLVPAEEEALNKEYIYYSNQFDIISKQMTK